MTLTPNLPVPVGAVADDWCAVTDVDGMSRSLTWSLHDTDLVGVAVDGWQYADGSVVRRISVYDAAYKELSAVDARRLAAALLNAADVLDGLR